MEVGKQCGRLWAAVFLTGVLAACGGGGGGGGGTTTTSAPAPAPSDTVTSPPTQTPPPSPQQPITTFMVGGTVTGLNGSVVLRDASGQQLTVSGSGTFSLAAPLDSGTPYAISVAQQPVGQTCVVSNGVGTVTATVSNISVACTTTTYPVQINLSATAAPVTFTLDRGGSLVLAAAGSGVLPVQVPHGQTFTVSSSTSGQVCTMTGETGLADGHPLAVSVACAVQAWQIGGTVQGSTGTLTLQNSDGQTVVVAGNTGFTFGTPVANGSSYAVTVASPPAGQTCVVGQGSGTASGNVSSVQVGCTAAPPVVLPPVPSPPTNLALSYEPKTFRFTWAGDGLASYYELIEDPDGAGPLPAGTVVSTPSTTAKVPIPVLLHERVNAQYSVRACSGGGCSAPTAVIQPDVNKAIGYFKASNPGGADNFGGAIAISADGSTMAIGAFQEDGTNDGVLNSGAVYVFSRSSGSWVQQAMLKAGTPKAQTLFGRAVALSADGNTLVVGAEGDSSNAGGVNGNESDTTAPNAGAAYVFSRAGATWAQQAYVKAPGGGNANARFGSSVAVSGAGDALAVGSREGVGGIYVYGRSASTWSWSGWRLTASNADLTDAFGACVSMSGDGSRLVVGAPQERSANEANPFDNSLPGAGAAYVFEFANNAWTQTAYLKASNIAASGVFGLSVAMSGDGGTVVVGAPLDSSAATGINGSQASGGLSQAGAAHVFIRTGSGWARQAYIKASNTGAGDRFGDAVSLSSDGNVLAVAAPEEKSAAVGIGGDQSNNGANLAGAVYVYRRDGSTWSQQTYLKASNTRSSSEFGFAISLTADGKSLAVGAPLENGVSSGVGGDPSGSSVNNGSGAAYLY